ncbi:MAG: SCO family protein [SAR324 cluster bacterium]|nr:SCO family protein [SAR324 cluster bacterium]
MKSLMNLPALFWSIVIVTLVFSILFNPVVFAKESSEDDDSGLMIYEGFGGNFTLTSHHGTPVSLDDYRGKVVLIFFGYTHCPDVCPATMSYLGRLVNKLDQGAEHVQTMFISVDPERDAPEQLKNYVTSFHPSFLGLTGTSEEILRVAKQFRVAYIRQEVKNVAGYFYAHTDYIYLVDTKGRVRALYRTDSNTMREMVADIKKLTPH